VVANPQPRVKRLYWLLQKLAEKDLSLREIDTPVSFCRLCHDIRLLKRMGFVSCKFDSDGLPGIIHLYKFPSFEEVRLSYIQIRKQRVSV